MLSAGCQAKPRSHSPSPGMERPIPPPLKTLPSQISHFSLPSPFVYLDLLNNLDEDRGVGTRVQFVLG